MNQREKEHTIVDIKIDEFERLDKKISKINKQYHDDIEKSKGDRKEAIKQAKEQTKTDIKVLTDGFKEQQQTAKAKITVQKAKNKEE